jgi:hypothetical protein
MELLTDEVRAQLPRLYAQESIRDPIVLIKYFTPDSNWTWFVTEGEVEENDVRFFGYVIGFAEEWGYFMLSELQTGRGPIPVERDLYFRPGPFGQTIEQYRRERGTL